MQRLAAAEQVLRGVQGLLMASDRVDAAAFSMYVESLNLGVDFAGLLGVGRLELVAAQRKAAHVAAMRGRGLPGYDIRPGGERALYAPVVQLEPAQGRNLEVPGLDPYAYPERRLALDTARDSGRAAITAKLGETDTPLQPSFAMYLPVYRHGLHHATVAQRRARLSGWVAAPFRIDELMASLYGSRPRGLHAQLYDGVAMRAQDLMYDSGGPPHAAGAAPPDAIEYMQVAGRTWTLAAHLHSDALADPERSDNARWIAAAGVAFSVLLSLLTWSLTTGRTRARAMAERMTQELSASEARFRHLAQYDELTQLPNRALFNDRLKLAVAHARRDHTRLALLFIDLDRFKPVNDAFGHRVGDMLLRAVAQRMVACVRQSDTVARIGGDEFVVLLPLVRDDPDALGVAEKIRLAIHHPFELEGGPRVDISSSTGVAFYPEHGTDELALAAHADRAMYQAKQAGRNTVVVYREAA